MLNFVMPYVKQTKDVKETIESTQYGIEVIFKTDNWYYQLG